MSTDSDRSSRRDFVADVGRRASVVALAACATPRVAHALDAASAEPSAAGDWDLSWIDRLSGMTDGAVFDWPTLGDPGDAIVLQIAERYLDNCDAAYGAGKHKARVVLNIRTQAVPSALADGAWERYALGAEYKITDPDTKQPAVRNLFWHRASTGPTEYKLPTLGDLVQRGAIVLVCDFALGHLSRRLATKAGRDTEEVHRELRGGFVPGAFAVPSGIFGLARAQNAGCGYVRM
jgi:hypothetical protein